MKVLVVANYAGSLMSFRGALLAEMVAQGHTITVAVPEPLGSLPEELAHLGITCRRVVMDRTGLNPLADIALFWRLWRLMRDVAPDLVLLYTIKPVIYGSLAAALAGVPHRACLVPGLGYAFGGASLGRRLLGTFARLLYRAALSGVDTVFFLNPDDRGAFVGWGLVAQARTAVVLGEGVDTTHYAPPTAAPEPASFLLISRLLWEKGVGVYADAARVLRARHPQVRCYLLGPPDPNPTGISTHQVEQWTSDGTLIYLGEAKDVRPSLARVGVFVLPSYYREGLPRTILEAMSMGRAIITTDAPGCRETVSAQDGNGVLVPTHDVTALVTAMERYVIDPTLAARHGELSRASACAVFAVAPINRVIIDRLGLGQTISGASHG